MVSDCEASLAIFVHSFEAGVGGSSYSKYTDKKENQIFLIYKEIQDGAVAKSYSI
jgi:hypothetical protein